MANIATITNVACTVCGCVCDDLKVTIDSGRIISAEKACHLAEAWFLRQNSIDRPIAEVHGIATDLSSALAHATSILKSSRSPLIYGLSRSTTDGQRAAVALAERLGGTIDTTAATGHAPSLMALQMVGESTCTLGEVKNRADLVIYWSSDPLETHPRHLERYSIEPEGLFLPNGRADRTLVVVDSEQTRTAAEADHFFEVDSTQNWEALTTLRSLIHDKEPTNRTLPDAVMASLRKLASLMRACKFGIVFFGSRLTREAQPHRTVEALLRLTSELNQYTRFYARRMRRLGDVAGADSVLTWQTGYPFAVNFATGYPRYNPGEFSAPAMLERGEVDAVLFVGSETTTEFPDAAIEALQRIPIIALESPSTESLVAPEVRITTAVYGVHRTGTAYRMDEVPIPLKVLLPTKYPSDSEILNDLLQRFG
jgi:formylmethanofuran dehydrogenase subunit B